MTGIAASHVAACLVTRGNVDMTEIVESLPFPTVAVWNNAGPAAAPPAPLRWFLGEGDRPDDRRIHVLASSDLAVYGRYACIDRVDAPVIYVQDDDCVLPPDALTALLAAYEPGKVVCNMPAPFRAHYTDSCLVGFGAIFDRDLPVAAFSRYAARTLTDFSRGGGGSPLGAISAVGAEFARCCDVVFTTLTPSVWADVPYRNLPYATGPDRMYRQPEHGSERARILDLARKARDA